MTRDHYGTNRDQSEYYGALQDLVDSLFPDDEWEPARGASADSTLAVSSAGTAASSTADEAAAAFGVSSRAASLLGLGALLEPGADGALGASSPASDDVPAGPTIRRLDAVLAAEAADLPDDLVRIVKLLPPGDYTRERLCTQLNSALTGHAWGQVYGTVV